MADENTQIMAARPLPVGHQLLWYEIEEILGQGGFGITYLAMDTNLNRKVAIKEYLPTIFAYRNQDFTVSPLTGDHYENYKWGLSSFLNEARTLAQFKHRNVVQVQTVFENHNTAYMVMEYEQGDSLSRLITHQRDNLDQTFYEKLLFPVMDGLQDIHNAGFIHRDIKPANIYLRSDGSPVLIDFGSARQTSQQDTGEMTTLISQGYTPLEQYSSNFGDQGPWTDIYSFGASVYHGITGKRPVDALNRSAGLLAGKEDSLEPLSNMGFTEFSPVFLEAIDCAMMLKPSDRPQTLSQWRSLFIADGSARLSESEHTRGYPVSGGSNNTAGLANNTQQFVALDRDLTVHRPGRDSAPKPDTVKKKSTTLPFAGVTVLLIGLGAGAWWYLQNQGSSTASTVQLTQERIASLPRPESALPVVEPKERFDNELSDLKSLSTIYQQALAIDGGSQPALDGIAYVVSQYARLAKSPFIVADEVSRNQLSNELSGLASIDPEAARLVQQLDALPNSNFASLSPLLNKDKLTDTEQQNLIAGLAALRGEEKAASQKDDRVVALSLRFRDSIVKSLVAGNFDQAARMIEVALLISPDDDGLDKLKRHIEGRG